MSKLRGFKRSLVALRGRENVHAFLVSKLGQTLGIHGTATFLFRLQRLSRIAGIDDQQQVTGIHTLDRLFQFHI